VKKTFNKPLFTEKQFNKIAGAIGFKSVKSNKVFGFKIYKK